MEQFTTTLYTFTSYLHHLHGLGKSMYEINVTIMANILACILNLVDSSNYVLLHDMNDTLNTYCRYNHYDTLMETLTDNCVMFQNKYYSDMSKEQEDGNTVTNGMAKDMMEIMLALIPEKHRL
jgi:hypothetical protein